MSEASDRGRNGLRALVLLGLLGAAVLIAFAVSFYRNSFETGIVLVMYGLPVALGLWLLFLGIDLYRHGRRNNTADLGCAVGAVVAAIALLLFLFTFMFGIGTLSGRY